MTQPLPFKSTTIPDDSYECHGCSKTKNLLAIQLPNLCNQELVLCPECRERLWWTI